MDSPIKLALYQSTSPAGSLEFAFEKITTMLNAAATAGADMIVFPELYLPGYNQGENIRNVAQPVGGEWQSRLCDLTKKANCGLTISFAERDGEAIYNSALALDKHGHMLAHFRKIQLYGEDEAFLFTPGHKYSVFDFNGRKAALLICYDVEFSQHCNALRSQGVDLILVPTATMQPYTYVTDILLPARALESGVAIVFCNYCGVEGNLVYTGGSSIIGPDGKHLAKAGNGETLLIADLSVTDEIPTNMLTTHLADYRPVE